MLPIVRRILRNNERRRQNRVLIRMRREIRERYDPFMLPDARFLELFRLDKVLVRDLETLLLPIIASPATARGIPVIQRILVTLRFLATGSYQRGLGEQYNFTMSQASVHNCIHQVINAISEHLVDEFIRFPIDYNTRNEFKNQFMEKFGFPGSVGAIDGTHVSILKPSGEDEQNYFNRKGWCIIILKQSCST